MQDVLLENFADGLNKFVIKYNSLVKQVSSLKQKYNDNNRIYYGLLKINNLLRNYLNKADSPSVYKQVAGNISTYELINVVDTITPFLQQYISAYKKLKVKKNKLESDISNLDSKIDKLLIENNDFEKQLKIKSSDKYNKYILEREKIIDDSHISANYYESTTEANNISINPIITPIESTNNSNIIATCNKNNTIFKYSDICNGSASGHCTSLIKVKKEIMKLNNDHINQINNFVLAIGNFERHVDQIDNVVKFFDNDDIFNESFYNAITSIHSSVANNIMVEFFADDEQYYIKKTDKSNKIIRNDLILKTTFFGAGNLSISLILNFLIKSVIDNVINISNVIVKIYPLQISHDESYKILTPNNDYGKKGLRLNRLMQIVFYKEALMNCYIRDNIIKPRISDTFVCTNDIYIAKGLPISFDLYKDAILQDEASGSHKWKNWLSYPEYAEDHWNKIFKQSHFGFIEMEKADITLEKINAIGKFDLGMLFEILYTKLCLAHLCNIYLTDDHLENIMVKHTEKIRKYEITRRGTKSTFYIANSYIIKYIDMERFDNCKDKNIFIDTSTDVLYNYYRPGPAVLADLQPLQFTDIVELQIAEYMFQRIQKLQLNNIDTFCDFMKRCLPSEYTDGDIETLKTRKGLNNAAIWQSYKIEIYIDAIDKFSEEEKKKINAKYLTQIDDINNQIGLLQEVANNIEIATLNRQRDYLINKRKDELDELFIRTGNSNASEISQIMRTKLKIRDDADTEKINSMIETYSINLDIEPIVFLNDFNKDTQIPLEYPYVPLRNIPVSQIVATTLQT